MYFPMQIQVSLPMDKKVYYRVRPAGPLGTVYRLGETLNDID